MEELKDTSIHHTAMKLLSEIRNMKYYEENILNNVQVCIPLSHLSLDI